MDKSADLSNSRGKNDPGSRAGIAVSVPVGRCRRNRICSLHPGKMIRLRKLFQPCGCRWQSRRMGDGRRATEAGRRASAAPLPAAVAAHTPCAVRRGGNRCGRTAHGMWRCCLARVREPLRLPVPAGDGIMVRPWETAREADTLRRQSDPVAASGSPWEDLAVFNPAAWYDDAAAARSCCCTAPPSRAPNTSAISAWPRAATATTSSGSATSRCSSPSVEGFDGATIQDPRIDQDGRLVLRHLCLPALSVRPVLDAGGPRSVTSRPTALRSSRATCGINATLTGLAMTQDFKTWIRAGWLTDPLLDDRDVILFPEKVGGKFVMIHRPLEWVGPAVRHRARPAPGSPSADDLLGFPAAPASCCSANNYPWEAFKLGVNTPPIKTPARLADDLSRRGPGQVLPAGRGAAGPRRPRPGAAPHARLAHAAGSGLRDRGLLSRRAASPAAPW